MVTVRQTQKQSPPPTHTHTRPLKADFCLPLQVPVLKPQPHPRTQRTRV